MSEKQFDALLLALQSMEEKFDKRFDVIDNRLAVVDNRLAVVDNRLAVVDNRFEAVENGLNKIGGTLGKVELQLIGINEELKRIEHWTPYNANQDTMARLAAINASY
jgi:archaellum component FlaC